VTRPARQKESRSLRLYARLLELYPPAFLQRHRAEMLQNFADLEDATESQAKLWLLIGKDLTMSLISHLLASRLGGYVIAVLVTWMLLFEIGYFFYGPTPGRPALHVFGGFLPGMLSMYIATRLYVTPQNSLYVIGVLVASVFSSRSGISVTAARPAIRLCKSSEAFCSACCPCPSRFISMECRKTARTPRVLETNFRLHQDLRSLTPAKSHERQTEYPS
jgi:hypothetical protein